MTKPVERGLEVSVAQLPKQDEYVLLSFDIDKWDIEEVASIYKCLQEQFPFNKVIGLPIETQINFFNKEEMLAIVENLKNCINSD